MAAFRREDLLRALPYARRYARALCGGQERGDALVTDAVRTLLLTCRGIAATRRPGIALYREITAPVLRIRWAHAAPGWTARCRKHSGDCCC